MNFFFHVKVNSDTVRTWKFEHHPSFSDERVLRMLQKCSIFRHVDFEAQVTGTPGV